MKNLRLIDTTENERIFNSSKDLSSAYVTLTVENKNLTYTIPNSYITLNVANGKEIKLIKKMSAPKRALNNGHRPEYDMGMHFPFHQEIITLGEGVQRLDMINDYPSGFYFTDGTNNNIIDINFDEFTITGDCLVSFEPLKGAEQLGQLLSGNKLIKSFHITKNFQVIPQGFFQSCTSLSSVTIDEGITKLDYGAFDGCSSLSGLTLPNSLEHLGTIGDMVNLKSLVVPEHVKFFSTVSFNNTPKLETLTLKSKTKVYDFIMALTRCQSLQSIYVQKNLLETYKTSKGWKDIADKIKPIED